MLLMTPRYKSENNNTINVEEMGLEGVDQIHVAQDREKQMDLVSTAIDLRRISLLSQDLLAAQERLLRGVMKFVS